jgi:hypothetical protein
MDVAADVLAKMTSEIACRLPPDANVSQSIANAEARLAKFTINGTRTLEK